MKIVSECQGGSVTVDELDGDMLRATIRRPILNGATELVQIAIVTPREAAELRNALAVALLEHVAPPVPARNPRGSRTPVTQD